ncbi:hypothetical protein, variant 2 [Aphanomyces invadans]|uniref:Alpha-1,3-glucosyltransferase n=2 Tax=Aphanomyces invadans TaxID=157072 RepID=A0A024UN75_9STRA|nr:hypothetical protein, variant 1 [Aphanomyces invadans]XP_008863398.1 hypothetical protein, variant 2 [Aphanomyces invadans]ETW07301.1 hypothetical protein, variant 1 [Aphanomyces invadans]ETW07302.1 hypothetical protein, variant 2 [Aphanomyces invadans]|eukprot:XP_008863397.1 hypothetical protein, variant 1 [Aphanomyces invadans]
MSMWPSLQEHNLEKSGSALVLVAALLVRWLVSLHSYSGMSTPPMFGDFEAQRHWMELTFHLPVADWYFYDLQYWGLDYPPLTAYVSYFFGYVAQFVEPELVALKASRGYETATGKVFMRVSVLVCDLVVFMPSLLLLAKGIYKRQWALRMEFLMLVLLQPAFILIDHGHFQYNNVSLGFTTLSVACILQDYEVLGSIFFSCALNFKQMALYYAPAITFYLVAKCLYRPNFFLHFAKLGAAVIGSFAVLWLPLCASGLSECGTTIAQMLHRVFPIARGLFEDKVANVWCCVDLFWKLRHRVAPQHLVYLCTAATFVGFLPSIVDLVRRRPTRVRFFLALFNSSMSFFLLSFQVHEKTILLPLLPMTFLLSEAPLLASWFGLLATFSMHFLLVKDGLVVPYIVAIIGYTAFGIVPHLWQSRLSTAPSAPGLPPSGSPPLWQRIYVVASIVGIAILQVLAWSVAPPSKYPHIHEYLFALYSCGHFVLALVYTTYWQWTAPGPTAADEKDKVE